jgi:hypothetical protein
MTQTIFRPRSPGNNWGYWKVEDLIDLPAATARHRKSIHFILTNEGLKRFTRDRAAMPTCCHCKNAIEDDGDIKPYGLYNPRSRRAKLWHYECGWGALLSDIIIDERANRILVPENIQL